MRKAPKKESGPQSTTSSDGSARLIQERGKLPPWMAMVLKLAAVYNLSWGALIVFFPMEPFRWMNLPPINYPGILQCLGMVVGVYGLGYWIASRDPVRYWPIVFVGFLGKVLGPIGMVVVIAKGELPAAAFWTCITNDLIWWLPFGIILKKAFQMSPIGLLIQR